MSEKPWQVAPLPPNESARLEKLRAYNILDTPPESVFDRLTSLAARHFNMPVALVSLVDQNRQWFKARYGIDATETPRDIAFCAHAILDNDVMVIRDATQDPRFAQNPLVTEAPDIRFYAGAPLATHSGHNIGTLCIIDRKPHPEFTEEQKQALADLAAIAIDEMELRIAAQQAQHDIEALKEAHAAMEEARQKAESSTKEKSLFVATISHELRTPMNGILGMAYLLNDTPLNDMQREYVETINHSAQNLLLLINDVLDVSKIEAGELLLDKAPFLIKPCVEQTINLLKPLAKKRGNILLSHVAGNVPAEIIGDRGRFSQIITNLIGNALKFTEWGKVEVVLRYDQEKNFIHCEVKDTGIGIPTNKQHKIFERFTQGDPSITQKYGGTGLGLAITKRLVVMLGGEIDFESEENVGTRFWFTLPVVPDCLFNREAAPPLSTSSSPNAIALPQRMEARMGHILIAEDHPVNQLFLIALLKKFGFAMIDVAENGLEAMKKIRQKAEGWKAHPYNIIFMDCKMPEQDGYETTRQIRAYESKTDHHAHTPIIAMTANAMAGDREICFAAGMDEYISKPLSPEHLKEILKKWFVFPEEAATIPVATVEHNAPPLDFSRLSMVTKTDKGKAEFLALFFSLTRKSLDAMQATLHNNDFPQWQHAAHSLKGASANMGMTRLERLCFQAEQAVDITALERDALLQLIKRELEYIKTYLRQSHPHLLREES